MIDGERLDDFDLELIQWELTGSCNLQCKFCYASSEPGKYEKNGLTKEEKKKLISEIKNMEPDTLQFLGGEPLLEKDLLTESIRVLNKSVDKFNITTNGTLIEEGFLEKIKPFKDQINIQIAVDGATEDVHDSLRGEGTFRKVMKSIDLVNDHSFQWSSTLLLNEDNFHQLRDIVELVDRKNGLSVEILNLSRGGRNEKWIDKRLFSSKQREEIMKKMKELREEDLPVYTRSFILPKHRNKIKKMKDSPGKYYGCGAPITRFAILPSRNLTPCGGLREDCVFSESFEDSSLKKAHERLKDRYIKRVREYKKNNCGDCDFLDQCLISPCRKLSDN